MALHRRRLTSTALSPTPAESSLFVNAMPSTFTVESCSDCHKKIDPLGFALENFDAVVVWRTSYESKHPVDPIGRHAHRPVIRRLCRAQGHPDQ